MNIAGSNIDLSLAFTMPPRAKFLTIRCSTNGLFGPSAVPDA